jgi:hypothetical protein
MMGDPQCEVLGQITPCSNNSCNCFFTSFTYRIDYLPIFDNGESGNNCISCSTSLMGGIHLGSLNTPMYSCINSSNSCFYSLVHPFRDAFTLIESSLDLFSLKKSKTYFLLELINFLSWLALTSVIFDLPLCALIM